ncbi:unnamed protein product [Linum tenue]|uniref:Uncharacterized protein n=1 Tax=Linum tenue TaxID=586396 RepID=A0AAV0IZH1_9ROSI|nr:unnamed protein product [Linum tenue]
MEEWLVDRKRILGGHLSLTFSFQRLVTWRSERFTKSSPSPLSPESGYIFGRLSGPAVCLGSNCAVF